MEPVLVIFGSIFMPMILVIVLFWLNNNTKNKQNQLQAELYAKAIEKGQELPANFFAPVTPVKKKKSKQLNTGIILIAVALSISTFFLLLLLIVENAKAEVKSGIALGIIPFFIGAAYLIIYFIEKKQEQKEDAK
jgi:hypothetical protein